MATPSLSPAHNLISKPPVSFPSELKKEMANEYPSASARNPRNYRSNRQTPKGSVFQNSLIS